MTDWTHAGAYVAAFALMTLGAVGVVWGRGWPAVALCALAVALAVAFRVAECRESVREAQDLKGRVAGMEIQLARLAKGYDAVAKDAQTALDALRARNVPGGRPAY